MIFIALYKLDRISIKKIINITRRYCWENGIAHKFFNIKKMNKFLDKLYCHRIDILFFTKDSDITAEFLEAMRQHVQVVQIFSSEEQANLPVYNPEEYLENPISKENLRTIFAHKLAALRKFSYEFEGEKREIEKCTILYLEYSENKVVFHKEDGFIETGTSQLHNITRHFHHPDFARINDTYVVNVRNVDRIEEDNAILKCGKTLVIKRKYRVDLLRDYIYHLPI